MSKDHTKFIKALEEIGLDLNEAKLNQFDEYYELLVEWNKVMNLTGITEYDEVILKHYIDSLAINTAIDMSKVEKLIDIGTGAGFPGLPLKIAYPHINVDLLDSLNKRIKFLKEVITSLGLENINAMHGRAEDYAKQPKHREQYDMCVSRAVANLATLSEYCLPYVKVGGYFVAFKAGNVEEELNASKNAIKILGGEIESVKEITLPMSDITRTFIIIKKISSTKNKYPRKAGLPAKEPLN